VDADHKHPIQFVATEAFYAGRLPIVASVEVRLLLINPPPLRREWQGDGDR
jgi:hypothetical protein